MREWIKSVFLYPKPKLTIESDDNYDLYWKEKRGKKIGELSGWQSERLVYIKKIIRAQGFSDIVIADIGCGDGSILKRLMEDNVIRVSKTVGYDISPFALNQARLSGIEVHEVDITSTEGYSNFTYADYYLLLEVLEHIPHSELLLDAVLKKSKRGVFISFPNTGYYRHRLRFMFGKFPLQWRIFPNEHVRFWTYRDTLWWLKSLDISNYSLHPYKGIPVLNRIFPSLFAAGLIINIKK